MVTGDELRNTALALPEAEERETWGQATFRVRGKIYVILADDGTQASIKASREEQAALLASEPEVFSPASHVGRFGWVSARLDAADPEALRELVVDAWRSTAPRRLVAEFDAATPG
ncbi:hypothetical protein CLV92_111124 [Kineococcus xinjiangensis]|uniref:DNA-binding protein (MmcQ/YjbR family) n=1 Tax=Kineococcus xinjiangensis TaxID=512762 RepID=A0A2S6IG94_9ACTN|nr:MmcQ/YjbR family DNA-binding protein [Kineococcus xinjiangensis]PPK93207.1 hypothetical protein CLV92_111124 [Kineococcus xinjiangensis]